MALNDTMSTTADGSMLSVGVNKGDDFSKLIAALGVAKQADSTQDNDEKVRDTIRTHDSKGADTSTQNASSKDKQTPEELKTTKASNVENMGAKALAEDY
eukprot:15355024-Ditylum_brightwellii.AAC.1